METVHMTQENGLRTLAEETRMAVSRQLYGNGSFHVLLDCYVNTQLRMLNFVLFRAEEETPCQIRRRRYQLLLVDS